MAGPGVPLLRIEGGDIRLNATVPEGAVKHVHVGATVPVTIDSLTSTALPSTVVSIAPQGDTASHTFVVKARLPAACGARSGMYGSLAIETGWHDTLTIPAAAVTTREGLSYVYVVVAGTAKLRLVSVGDTSAGRAAVLSGLSPGDRVVAEGVSALHDNQPVTEAK